MFPDDVGSYWVTPGVPLMLLASRGECSGN